MKTLVVDCTFENLGEENELNQMSGFIIHISQISLTFQLTCLFISQQQQKKI